jgi:uncharacterized protein YuzE
MDRDRFSVKKDSALTSKLDAARLPVPLAIGGVRFSHADYDEHGDLLYLTKGTPLGPADDDTAEGHPVFLGDDGRVIGVLVMGARWHLERDGSLNVTLRHGGPTTHLARTAIEPLLVETIHY